MAAHPVPKGTGLKGIQSAVNDHATALDAIIADLATLKAGVNALDTAMDTLITKMNSDGGITDADYAGAAAAGTIGTLTAAALDGDTLA